MVRRSKPKAGRVEGSVMRIGIVSDTHGHVANAQAAVRMLQALDVERVLHCGDIGTAEVVACFAAWPTDFVFGNCDGNRGELAVAIEDAGDVVVVRFERENRRGRERGRRRDGHAIHHFG